MSSFQQLRVTRCISTPSRASDDLTHSQLTLTLTSQSQGLYGHTVHRDGIIFAHNARYVRDSASYMLYPVSRTWFDVVIQLFRYTHFNTALPSPGPLLPRLPQPATRGSCPHHSTPRSSKLVHHRRLLALLSQACGLARRRHQKQLSSVHRIW